MIQSVDIISLLIFSKNLKPLNLCVFYFFECFYLGNAKEQNDIKKASVRRKDFIFDKIKHCIF